MPLNRSDIGAPPDNEGALRAEHRLIVGLISRDAVAAGSLRGFMAMETLCTVSKGYQDHLACIDWQFWKGTFDNLVRTPVNAAAHRTAWRPYYEIYIGGGAENSDAYVARVNQQAASMPRQTEAQERELAIFWKESVKAVILQKLIFGAEASDPYDANASGESLLPGMYWLLAQTSVFLSRRNGSASAVVALMLQWHKKLKAKFPQYPKISVAIASDLFKVATLTRTVQNGAAHYKHMDKVPEVIAMLQNKWVP